MKTLLTLALLVVGTLMLITGGAATVFTGGGVAGALKELAMATPGGAAVWDSPGLGIGGGLALVLLGFWMSRR